MKCYDLSDKVRTLLCSRITAFRVDCGLFTAFIPFGHQTIHGFARIPFKDRSESFKRMSGCSSIETYAAHETFVEGL